MGYQGREMWSRWCQTKKHYYKSCARDTEGAQHRADNERSQFKITSGFVIAWIGLLIIFSGKSCRKGSTRLYWTQGLYGYNTPYVMNSMRREAFEFLRRFIHFTNKQKKIINPLHKVQYVLDKLLKNLKRAWIAGRKVVIDESMIRYKGKAVKFTQYMPAKPIKHEIIFSHMLCLFCRSIRFWSIFGKRRQYKRLFNKSNSWQYLYQFLLFFQNFFKYMYLK